MASSPSRIAPLALLICGLALLAEQAPAAQRVYGIDARGKHLFKPARVLFGAHGEVRAIHWTEWGGERARGRGTYPYNDCMPSCAEGRITPYPVSVIYRRRLQCRRKPTYVRFVFTFNRGRKPAGVPRDQVVPFVYACSVSY